MQHINRREVITAATAGTRIDIGRICRDLAARTTAPAQVAGATAIDDRLLGRLLLAQLESIGPLTGSAAFRPARGELRRWWHESLRYLRAQGILHGDPARPAPGLPGADKAWASWEGRIAEWRGDPAVRAQADLLDTTLRAIPDIVRGAVPATDVMFPRSSMELVEGIYRDNPVADCFNATLADAAGAVAEQIVQADPAAGLRILEIGAGTGGGSVKVFERLDPLAPHVAKYTYTDLSRSFLQHAEREYGPGRPYLEYRIFDVEKPVTAQQIELGSYDLVLATNVLHATKDIRQTLRNAKALLKQHGVLLATEITAHSLFAHLTFGLLEGWWRYEDEELRIPGCPGLTPESWDEVLEDEGFDSVSFPAEPLHYLGHQVIAAVSDGMVRQEVAPVAAPSPEAVLEPVLDTKTPHDMSEDAVQRHVKDVIFDQLKASLKVDRTQIGPDDAFMDYGIDSIIGVQLIQEINRHLGSDLSTTDLFDHGSVNRLARHLVATLPPVAATPPQEPPASPVTSQRPAETAAVSVARVVPRMVGTPSHEPIAVVGMSARFGGSATAADLWDHLVQGHDLTEPVSRWDLSRYQSGGAQACERGSFIDGIDEFDPEFFNISGVEATYMDPQQRLFLEESWKALEDAGYAGAGVQGTRVGVYVGCQDSGYAQLFGGSAPPQAMWGNALSAMPARISYHLDLQGPAIAVDTACSSSLVAIHLACQGLWGGETEMALAGGVSVQCTPQFYMLAGQAGMLSPTGRCHTFDERADGFVPGEGVGVVVLKRLSDALAAGDHLRGIISGSGVNQDGASNGITAPSAASQERLLTSVYDTFAIDPGLIGMLEAHGTGTKLGDPIEYRALQRAFRRYTQERDYCALGSVKSNLGHTITAAGVAGVIKVLLALKHRRIPPSINFERANPRLDLTNSPFFVNTMDRLWEPASDGLRHAAVSSFGVSGTNAHVVIDEAPEPTVPLAAPSVHLITLSAGTAGQLAEQVRRLLAHSERHPGLDLDGVAFTLMLGRKHLAHRVACVVRDQGELEQSLRACLAGTADPHVCAGDVPAHGASERAALRAFGDDCVRRVAAATDTATRTELLAAVADLYVQGYGLDYAALFAVGCHVRVPLPTYPFARDRYWVRESRPAVPARTDSTVPHPLLHTDVSDFGVRRYRTRFTGAEPILTDHVVKGRMVLPGVACLEMARAAAELRLGGHEYGVALRNVAWVHPVTVDDEPVVVVTSLTPDGYDEADYAITGTADGDSTQQVVYSQGRVVRTTAKPDRMDLEALRKSCSRAELTDTELYPAYEAIGFNYGPTHRGLRRLHIGRDQVLAQLVLPEQMRATRDAYVLHPSMLDMTLQASLGMGSASGGTGALGVTGMKPSLPFALDEMEVLGPCTDAMWAWIRYSPGSRSDGTVLKLDADVSDEQGEVRVRLRGLSYRVLEGEVGAASPETSRVDFLPQWCPARRLGDAETLPRKNVVLLPEGIVSGEALARHLPLVRLESLQSEASGIAQRFTDYAVQTLATVRELVDCGARDGVSVQLVVRDEGESAVTGGLLGLLKSARAEEPGLWPQLILADPGVDVGQLAALLMQARECAGESCLRYRDGRIEALGWREARVAAAPVPWRDGGIYLITGGLGGLGVLVAGDMAAKVRGVTLVLAGRSDPGARQQAILDGLREQGANVSYSRLDVADPVAVRKLIDDILREHGALHGIVHAAGVLADGLVRRKSAQECRAVLAPKVAGLVNLDEATRDVSLEFLVAFSGAAGVFGNIGQADYAAASAFLDAYQQYRSALVVRGERTGASVSIDWPLWADGGMRVTPAVESVMRQRLGMTPMPAALGLEALYAALAAPYTRMLVVAGEKGRIRDAILETPAAVPPSRVAAETPGTAPASGEELRAALVTSLRGVVAEAIKVPVHRLEPAMPFERFGIDSVLALAVTNRLESDFGSLPKTLFFEYQNLDELSSYFLDAHAESVRRLLGASAGEHQQVVPLALEPAPIPDPVRREYCEPPASARHDQDDDAIAVVALAGRYPGANDLEEFWANLVAGRDMVTEVPVDRWDHTVLGGKDDLGRTPPPWGGFLDGVADFDALFFQTSPREAAIMDPQIRLFLECVWNLLEGAGYTRDRLRDAYDGRVGVYVGTMYQHYQLLSADPLQAAVTSVMSGSAVANRVSHFFDLCGPSLAIDTTCSSSLVAIHLACEELRRGTCDMMIAGGVNLSLHPRKYVGLSLTGLTGTQPGSRAFTDGDGFIPAEGVGAVLLKPLGLALRDDDDVLAVIRASASDYKGRTSGPMVPHAGRQARLIAANLERAGVHPRTVSYAEASANGSQLGDAIEFAGLRRAFAERTTDEGFCALGTVKSTLGNLEAASGVAQLSKVVLQLAHRTLVPSAVHGRRNPGVDLDGTAFRFPATAESWERPVVALDGPEREYPRTAIIIGLGAGGSNAHLVVQEHIGCPVPETVLPDDEATPQVMVLSARTEERLRVVVTRLRDHVRVHPGVSLADLAYTLQCGREAMDSRIALVARDTHELLIALDHYLSGDRGVAPVPLFTGTAGRDDADLALLPSGEAGDALVRELLAGNHAEKLALFWAHGSNVPWEDLPRGARAPRMLRSLPTYPFDRRRYWVDDLLPEDVVVGTDRPASSVLRHGSGTDAAQHIRTLVADLLGVRLDELDQDASLADLGFTSMLAPQLLKVLQTEVDAAADLAALAECRSTEDVIRRFAGPTVTPQPGPTATAHAPELIALNAVRGGRPVFWIHGGLGGVEVYSEIASASGRTFYGIQARGWMTRDAPVHGVTALAAHYARLIRTVQPEGPYDLGGYSFGGLLAYEITRQLQERGETVESVVMVDAMYGDHVKAMTMSRTDMLLQQVNALLAAGVRPGPQDSRAPFVAANEVDWTQDEDRVLDDLLTLARGRGLKGQPDVLGAQVRQHLAVQEAYGVQDYDVAPLPRPDSVSCFYFRNGSELFFGELEPIFSTADSSTALDHVDYWACWRQELPDFHLLDVDSANHFVMLAEPASLRVIRSFCALLYSGQPRRLRVAKAWMTRKRRARENARTGKAPNDFRE